MDKIRKANLNKSAEQKAPKPKTTKNLIDSLPREETHQNPQPSMRATTNMDRKRLQAVFTKESAKNMFSGGKSTFAVPSGQIEEPQWV